jgi:uncharacterized membrane protein YfcA
MPEATTIFVAAVFALAGFAKGVIGLGLPTISMGLLAVVMAPMEAAAILVLPSFLTNVWQMAAGPSLHAVVRRLWPMMLGVCLGTWAATGLMTWPHARHATSLLGVAILLYALTGLYARTGAAPLGFSIRRAQERWLAPIIGGVTGATTAATGVFVIPAVPYLEAIGLEKEDLVQALGLSFTVSTVALAINLAFAGALGISIAGLSVVALSSAGAGMWIGQALRLRARPEKFRRWFFAGLLLLGLYLIIRSVV